MLTDRVPRVGLAHLPTAIEELPRLSQELGGPRLFVKRDDQTGLGGGGNKTRKLEFVVADALAQGAHTLVTTGAVQSNHCAQTAAAAARMGLRCVVVLGGSSPGLWTGNLLMDALLGARIVWAGLRDRNEVMDEVADQENASGHPAYQIPLGASNDLGACGYVAAMEELVEQVKERRIDVDHLVVASSSGGTQAGMAVGARALNFEGRIVGIAIDSPEAKLRAKLTPIANRTAGRLGLDLTFVPGDFTVYDGYLGEGYAVMGDLERDAIHVMAHMEGIFLDPVYTGRAMGGLIDLIRSNEFSQDETVLFWHTGGRAALFAYAEPLLQSTSR